MRRPAFSFAEVLFAIMILGIGFIMVAALFPVALVQSKLTQEETAGASMARGGANYLEQLASNATMPATGVPAKGLKPVGVTLEGSEVRALDQMAAVHGSLLLGADQRFAWVPFYRRSGTRDPAQSGQWSQVAQVYMIPVAVRNRSQFDKGVPAVIQQNRAGPNPPAAFGVARLVANIVDSTASTTPNPDQVDYIEFTDVPANNNLSNNGYTAVADGAYVIVASAPPAPPGSNLADPDGAQARVGHIFRIGNPTPTQPTAGYPRRWQLVPGNDYVPLGVDNDGDGNAEATPEALLGVNVFVVGRSLADPSAPYAAGTNEREATALDIGAYTTFVNIR
jgi:hypothetical protein